MSQRIFVCAAAAALLFAHPALAHHPTAVSGAGGAGPINTISASTLDAARIMFSATYELIRFGGLSDADLTLGAALSGTHAHSIRMI